MYSNVLPSVSSPTICNSASPVIPNELTHDLQLRKPRLPKRPQLPPGEAGTPVRRIVHTAVYKQKLFQYNETLKLYDAHIDELLQQTTTELEKIINSKLQPCHSK